MAKELSSGPVFTVTAPPHWHCGRTVSGLMSQTILALMPAAVLAVAFFGFDALRVMALSCATAVITEYLCLKAMGRDIATDNYSSLLVGLLFAFLMPATAPWWVVIVGSAVSIALGRMVFGGLGGNPMCAPVIGWAVLRISWPTQIDIDAMMLNTERICPISQLKYLGLQNMAHVSYSDMLLGGGVMGGLGAMHILALLAGGIYLISRGYLRWHIPAAFLAGVFITALIYNGMDSTQYASPVFHLLAGNVMFAAFFLIPDHSSSPAGKTAMLVYGLLAGVLVMLIRIYGIYPDGVPFAVLLANLMTPLIDMIRPKPFGAR
ncbi:MAG: RnfABCDGE type electron transport complex subunit D [Desulfovibrionaceae bacterium]